MSKTVQEKQIYSTEVVHEAFLKCAKIIVDAVKDLDGFDNSEKFMTQQRIVNRIYVGFNQIVFKVAEKTVQAGDL